MPPPAAAEKNIDIRRAASYNQYQPSAPVGQPFSVEALEKHRGAGYIQAPFFALEVVRG
jgi:hypothetical protein